MQGDESEDPEGDGLELRTRRIAPQDPCADAAAAVGCRVGADGSFAWLLLLVAALARRRSKGGS
jgi:MYXO-CTERM domain-containing protein